jgi:hypothetical protein
MAKAKLGFLFRSVRGKIGGNVIRKTQGLKSGEVIIQSAPVGMSGEPTEAQSAQQARFTAATNYAKIHKNDPEYVAAAAGKLQSPWNFAIQDALKEPTVKSTNHFALDISENEFSIPPYDLMTAGSGDTYRIYFLPSSPTVRDIDITPTLMFTSVDEATGLAATDPAKYGQLTPADLPFYCKTLSLPNSTEQMLCLEVVTEALLAHRSANGENTIYFFKLNMKNRAGKTGTVGGIYYEGENIGKPENPDLIITTIGCAVEYLEANL